MKFIASQSKIFLPLIILLVFGLIVLSSAGIVDGQKKFDSSYYYLFNQIIKGVLPGLLLFFIFSKIDYKKLKSVSFLGLIGAIILSALVFFPGLGLGLKGASRWVVIGGFSFQPSEILKLSLVVYLSAWFAGQDQRIKQSIGRIAPFLIVLGLVAFMLLKQPDTGTLLVTGIIAIGLYFVSGAEWSHFFGVVGVMAALVLIVALFRPYQMERIKTFLNPSADPQGSSYQLNQSLIAIGSGGIFGVGYGQSTQKLGFLPEVVNDSIFAIIVEELGIVGGLVTIGLFVWLFWALVSISKNCTNRFGSLLAMGMGFWVIGQAFLNIAAISGLAPLTGVPLPLISYGGTATMALLAGMGIVNNVAKE